MIIEIRNEKRQSSRQKQKFDEGTAIIPKHLKVTESIVKPPRDKDGNRILPPQYPTKANTVSI